MNEPSRAEIRRWRRYLADERAEAAVYRDLASRRSGDEREILVALADAEARHEAHWVSLLGEHAERVPAVSMRTRVLGFFARRFGSVFVLALAQRAESRSPYEADAHATPSMAADERIHSEVVRGLAARGRQRLSGTFRAAVFGANDGLVSNLALVMGIGAAGLGPGAVLLTGLAGLLAGALSMGAGEYVSVRSQRELLEASTPDPDAHHALPHLDVDANELALVYRARGMAAVEADDHARRVLAEYEPVAAARAAEVDVEKHEAIGSAWGAAGSSFAFFASGAIIPVIPYLIGLEGITAVVVAAVLVGIALLITGAIVGVLSGASPLARALRQLAIGYGAAAATYLLGLAFGASIA
ncbi:MAG: VIT1/CCC1 transporter family protein [Microcella sp.]|uniref:VIT1/CCC1 transporter family protein n=1 Tax=Microcella sp. TaxID=1913979 RepID=UPI0024CD363B|nr:VIT1/CCC1 family protein [Microcella sp.]UYN84703.1 MAG: VIT1/CCC1 transporter family protein [Microcella sp.]